MSSKSCENRCHYHHHHQPNYSYNQLLPHCQPLAQPGSYSHQLNDSKHMIRCTFVIILSILLLLISVSGFFILLISNDSTIFYPYTQTQSPTRQAGFESPQFGGGSSSHSTTSNNFLFYTSTIFQLTLIIIEVLIALVIIFICECDTSMEPSLLSSNPNSSSTAATYFNYNQIPSCSSVNGQQLTKRAPKSQPNNSNIPGSGYPTSRCNLIYALKIAFIILVCVSFVLRFVTSSWGSIFLSNDSSVFTSSLPSTAHSSSSSSMSKLIGSVNSGNFYFNGIIYVSTLLELILFLLVLTTTTSQVSSTIRLVSSNR